VFDEYKGVFSIRHVATEALKGRGSSITVHMPPSWTPFYRRWLDQVRPALVVDEAPHDFLFLSKTGAPLKTISRVVVKALARSFSV
jgi:site-specific recombinase XerD